MANYDQNWSQNYNTYGGVNINIAINDVVLGSAQGLSVSVTREKAPIFVMGHVDPVSFTRGKRGIAGSLLMTMFDKDPIAQLRDSNALRDETTYHASRHDILYRAPGSQAAGSTTDLDAMATTFPAPFNYPDQILPITITLVGANEYNGLPCSMRIYGVEFLNEGMGTSTGDISLEAQMTFVARAISPWGRNS